AAYRLGGRAYSLKEGMGPPAPGGCENFCLSTYDAAYQAADHRWRIHLGRLNQFRHALLAAQRRSQPEYLQQGFCKTAYGSFRGRPRSHGRIYVPDVEEAVAAPEGRGKCPRTHKIAALTLHWKDNHTMKFAACLVLALT